MEALYKGITLEGKHYKVEMLCKDFEEYKKMIGLLQKEQPGIARGLALLLKDTKELADNYDTFELLLKEQ